MPRLFTGVEIPADVAFDLDLMRGGIIGSRWIDRESFHITLRFIGDIDEGLAREIAYELDGVEAFFFAAEQELSKASAEFDLTEHRFDHLLAQSISTTPSAFA